MTEDSERDLVKRAEAALSGLTLREPDWDGFAERIDGAVKNQPLENVALFDAPLPATAEEGSEHGPAISIGPESTEEVDDDWSSAPEAGIPAEAQAAAAPPAAKEEPEEIDAASEPAASDEPPPSPREGVSLADLARASIAKRGAKEHASIARESLAVATQSRAQGEQIAQRVHSVRPPASVPPPAPSSRQVPTVPPARLSQQAQKSESGDVLRGPWVGIVIGAVGLAAGFGLYLRSQHSESQPVAVAEQHEAKAIAPAAAPEPALRPVATRPATPEAAAAPEAKLEPSTLESLTQKPAPRADTKPGAGAKPESTPPAPAPAAGGKVVAEKIVLDEEKPGPKPAPSGAPHPGDTKLRPAELSSAGGMTERPSAGAAQAAVGAVLGAARACVAGHPQPSSAQITFSSDGQVEGVSVGGPAAGTPAAACIESALKKARVQPFAASSFSLGVTVRPP
ncbi:MAG TPA: hypothetical protein VFV94_06525 [Polyangiaceae bacterium]|nr:hypothetical protein [Polyangiaceae bacterium]